jgi:hypothetical protein
LGTGAYLLEVTSLFPLLVVIVKPELITWDKRLGETEYQAILARAFDDQLRTGLDFNLSPAVVAIVDGEN